jgi:hypothetical protein
MDLPCTLRRALRKKSPKLVFVDRVLKVLPDGEEHSEGVDLPREPELNPYQTLDLAMV